MGYGEALRHVHEQLVNAGLTAVLDPRDLADLPGAWVEPDTMVPTYLDGSFDAQVVVLLVVPDNGNTEALDNLTDMVQTIQEDTDLYVPTVEFTRAVLDNLASDPLPAARFTTTVQVSPHAPPESAPAGSER